MGYGEGMAIRSEVGIPQFFAHWDEFIVQPGEVSWRSGRLIIPPLLFKTVLDELNQGHLGVEKMKSLARPMCW